MIASFQIDGTTYTIRDGEISWLVYWGRRHEPYTGDVSESGVRQWIAG